MTGQTDLPRRRPHRSLSGSMPAADSGRTLGEWGRFSGVKAAVLHGPRDLRVESAPSPRPGPGEVLVRVADGRALRHGLSHLDRATVPCAYPLVPGHEFVGRVERDVGPGVTRVRVGDAGRRRAQLLLRRLPALPRGQPQPLPEPHGSRHRRRRLLRRARARTRALLLAGAGRRRRRRPHGHRAARRGGPRGRRAAVRPGESAAVVGGGTLGLLALQVLRARGARVLVVSRTARRFALARELGAEATHAAGGRSARKRPPAAFSGREGVDVVIETAGTRGGRRARPGAGPAGRAHRAHRAAARAHAGGVLLRRAARGDDHRLDDLPGRVPRGDAARSPTAPCARGPLVTHRFGLDADRRGVRRPPSTPTPSRSRC